MNSFSFLVPNNLGKDCFLLSVNSQGLLFIFQNSAEDDLNNGL